MRELHKWQHNSLFAANIALVILTLFVFAFIAWRYVSSAVTVRNVDYFQFVELAQGLELGSLRTWVSGMHPIGYPLLIRWGLAFGLDAVQIGHVLSIVGGALLLLSAYLLAYQLTHNPWLAFVTQAFLFMTGYFLYFSTWEGNDMLSAGLQALSLALLVGHSDRKTVCFGAGLLAGLAYVIRYTAIVTIVLFLIFLVGRALRQQSRSAWAAAGLCLAGFLVGAAVQLVPSALVTGNPFYSSQGRNVWWHLEGLSDFATDWNLAPEDVSPIRLFLDNPARFIGHWWNTVQSFWLDPGMLLLDRPLRLLTQAGLIFTLLAAKDIAPAKRTLMALYVLGFLAALAIIRYDPRFLLVLLPILAFCAVYFVWAIIPRQLPIGRFSIPVGALTFFALLVLAQSIPLHYIRNRANSNADVLAVTQVLRASGMLSANEVLSSAIQFHDVSVPARARFAQSYWIAPDMNSLDELHALANEKNYRFFLYDAQTGLKAHPGLGGLLNPNNRPQGMTPLLVPENRQFVLYRIEPESSQPSHSLEANLEDGIVLTGHDLFVVLDAPDTEIPRIGLFIYWQATHRLDQSYKVFVHVLDAAGQLVAQDDGLPALWTHLTTDWQVGEDIVDFHSIALPPETPPGTYTLQIGMYDERTMQRLAVLNHAGVPVDDKVTLTQLLLPPVD